MGQFLVTHVISQNDAFFQPVPGPCEPEDLIDGIIFAANYLGCTQVLSDKNPSKSVRMSQAQEAIGHIKVSRPLGVSAAAAAASQRCLGVPLMSQHV